MTRAALHKARGLGLPRVAAQDPAVTWSGSRPSRSLGMRLRRLGDAGFYAYSPTCSDDLLISEQDSSPLAERRSRFRM